MHVTEKTVSDFVCCTRPKCPAIDSRNRSKPYRHKIYDSFVLHNIIDSDILYPTRIFCRIYSSFILEWTTSLDSSSGTLICSSVHVTSDVIITYHCSGG